MRAGPDVIYQGTLFDGRWLGFPDFLMRDERPSELGAWSYEVADAKLAREAKAAAVLQTSVYSQMLARVQCAEPERIYLYLGGRTSRRESFRLAHFGAYQRSLERRLADHLAAAPDELPLAPEPVEHCQVCEWRSRCKQERTEAESNRIILPITDPRRPSVQLGRRPDHGSPLRDPQSCRHACGPARAVGRSPIDYRATRREANGRRRSEA